MKQYLLAAALTVVAFAKPAIPPEVQGRWVTASSSGTNYWNNGTFVGNAGGSGQLYEFQPNGKFNYYMVMEMRTYGMLSRVRTNCTGTVDFTANTFTLHPTSGHYHSEMGSKVTDRPMNADDLARLTKTSNWRIEQGADGKTHFVVPFDDGSKHDFVPAESP
jgi:hypothetical protein